MQWYDYYFLCCFEHSVSIHSPTGFAFQALVMYQHVCMFWFRMSNIHDNRQASKDERFSKIFKIFQLEPIIENPGNMLGQNNLLVADLQTDYTGVQFISNTGYTQPLIGHFTVGCLVTWPMTASEAGGDLALIQTSLLFS